MFLIETIIFGIILLLLVILYFLLTKKTRQIAKKYSAVSEAVSIKEGKKRDKDHEIIGKVIVKANLCHGLQTVLGIILLFFPIWFIFTELTVAYGLEFEGTERQTMTFVSSSPTICDCDDPRVKNVTHDLNPDCAYSCSYTENVVANNTGMKACTCTPLNGYSYEYNCIVPCGFQPFGYPYAEIKYESSDLYCAIIDDLSVREATRCKTLFGDDFPELDCPSGYDCYETHDKVDSCTNTCFWSAAKTTRQWKMKYRKGWTKYYHDPSWELKGDSASAFTVDVHFGISGCKNGFITLNGKVLCVDNIAILPNWLYCKEQEFTREQLFSYIVKDLFQSPGLCDTETKWERDHVQLSPFENSCSMQLKGTASQCSELGIMQCTKGTYESHGDYVTVHFPHICKLGDLYKTAHNFTSCQGCNKDCSWSPYEGTGVNSSCSFTKYSNMTETVKNLHETNVHKSVYWIYVALVTILESLILVSWVIAFVRIQKLNVAYYRTRNHVQLRKENDDYFELLDSITEEEEDKKIVKARLPKVSRVSHINAKTAEIMKLKNE